MSTAICPTCEKEIDPARAPIARIRGGHVLTFCSTACAAGTPAAPPPEPASPPAPIVVRPEAAPVRAEETASSRAWYDKADEAVATDVDEQWDDDSAEAEASAPARRERGYTWDDRSAAGEADANKPDYPARKPPLGKRHVLMIAGAILVGGMVIAIIEAVSPSSPSPVAASDAHTAGPATPEPAPIEVADETPADAAIDRDRIAAAAVAELRTLMKSESPRIVRDAALALSRTGDAEAIELLAKRLGSEPSPHARVRVAYALARAGDRRGVPVLMRALEDKRRDLRMDGARALARLGNDAGRNKLRAMLSVRTHKIGAAGVLALLGDDKGLEALRGALEDDSPEARMRAAVYLGLAGQAEVRDRLRKILEGGDRVGAANALAALGDDTAVPALVEQLDIAAVRVDAAISLRRLGAEVDLEPLAVALVESDEIGRVSAAEAILVLVAPKPPAELR